MLFPTYATIAEIVGAEALIFLAGGKMFELTVRGSIGLGGWLWTRVAVHQGSIL